MVSKNNLFLFDIHWDNSQVKFPYSHQTSCYITFLHYQLFYSTWPAHWNQLSPTLDTLHYTLIQSRVQEESRKKLFPWLLHCVMDACGFICGLIWFFMYDCFCPVTTSPEWSWSVNSWHSLSQAVSLGHKEKSQVTSLKPSTVWHTQTCKPLLRQTPPAKQCSHI